MKKKQELSGYNRYTRLLKRVFRVMKLVAFFITISIASVFANKTYSQSKLLDLNMENATVREVILEIEKQSEFHFMYSGKIVDVNRGVSLELKGAKIDMVLSTLFAGTEVNYTIKDRVIVLNTRESVADETASQGRTISGKVTDSEGLALPGVTVMLKGTTKGTITDIDGKYTVADIPSAGGILVFSFMGMETQELAVQDDSVINVEMTYEAIGLKEIVAVGYGTQRKINLTGSVGSIKIKESLESRPVTNVQELLSGAVPGMLVTKGSGAVGSAANINIRGTSTIGKSSGVLVLIDGVPGNINTLNPNDVAEISVLKDAASAAIYGSRAANGVILVTTKSPEKMNRPIVELSSSIGIQNPQHKLDFVGSADFMNLYDQAMINDGKEPVYGQQGLDDLRKGLYADNKWYKEIYRKNTVINNNYLSFSGSEKSIDYRMSVSNDNQQGTLPNNEYSRLTIKPNITLKLSSKLEAQANIQYTQTSIKEPFIGTELAQSQASRIAPIIKIRESNGLYGLGGTMGNNPIADLYEGGSTKNKYKELLTVFDLRYSPIADLNLRGNVAYYTYDQQTKKRSQTYNLYNSEGEIAKTINPINMGRNDNSSNYTFQMQFIADYTKTLSNAHTFKVLGGYSQEYRKNENFWASRENLPFTDINVLDLGSLNKQNGGTASHVAIQSIFGRINYDYMSRYLFEVNIRGDGSSRFAKGHRWGVFPSFSGGWNVHMEEFMKNQSWVSQLKLRVSWGELGDSEKSNIGYYPTATLIVYDPKMYSFGGKLVSGAYNNKAINPILSWETSQMTNIGLDIGVLNQRINVSVEYFINNRKDILYSPPAPSEFGLNAPLSNLLKMRNQGWEFMTAYNDRKGDFTWGIDFNCSFSKNKMIEMGENDMWIEGNSITYLNDRYQLPYGFEAIGLFQSEDEIEKSPTQGGVKPGNIKYKDQNNDGIIDGEDRTILNRKVPINFGGNIRFGYKNFDFSANFYGRLNVMNYLSDYSGWAFFLSENARPIHKDSWTPENPNASYPRLTLVNTANDTQYNSFWLRKADYLKLQNIQVGYTLPKASLEKLRLQYLRIYLAGQNLATITGYDGFDPEGGWYPLQRTFSLGFNLKF
ncbi:MAG: TonB-dependent receptor [Bacteroidales bacterium]